MSMIWISSATLGVGIFMFFIAYRKSISASVSGSKKWLIQGTIGMLIVSMGITGIILDTIKVNQRTQEIWANVAAIKAETAKIEATTAAMETETANQAHDAETETPTPGPFNP